MHSSFAHSFIEAKNKCYTYNSYTRVELLIYYLKFLFCRNECVLKVLCAQCAVFYITLNAEKYFDVEYLFKDDSIIEFLFFVYG